MPIQIWFLASIHQISDTRTTCAGEHISATERLSNCMCFWFIVNYLLAFHFIPCWFFGFDREYGIFCAAMTLAVAAATTVQTTYLNPFKLTLHNYISRVKIPKLVMLLCNVCAFVILYEPGKYEGQINNENLNGTEKNKTETHHQKYRNVLNNTERY